MKMPKNLERLEKTSYSKRAFSLHFSFAQNSYIRFNELFVKWNETDEEERRNVEKEEKDVTFLFGKMK
jgi:hypothetical protein